MNGYKFEVGDEVECVRIVSDSGPVFVHTGIVVHVERNYDGNYDLDRVGVDWGNGVGGHHCDGHCPDGHGWYVDGAAIELIDSRSKVKVDVGGLL